MTLKDTARYRNFLSLLFLPKGSPATARLWNGLQFSGSNKKEMLNIIEEICFRDDYRMRALEAQNMGVVIDVGANIGVFSVLAATRAAKVYAFEPFPPVFEYLNQNISLNHSRNIEAFNSAVGAEEGKVEIMKGTSLGGNIATSLIPTADRLSDTEVCLVEQTTLASFYRSRGIERVDFLKMDCEGGEGYIFAGLSDEDIRRSRRYAIEFHDNVSSLKHEEISARLNHCGFTCDLVWDGSHFGYIHATRRD